MNIVLWILAGALALAFTAGALAQLTKTKESYRRLGRSQYWVDDFTSGQIKAIGTTKLIGATGLILPAALGIVPVLTPVAACGLALFMSGAATTRFRRMEWNYLLGDLVFLGLFAFLAWGRFVLEPF
ncbi:DoxX family protein [Aeromicrobium choanae]|uniref:DoxX-like family protein n=1 Tax=Aeromicrobium choanae TaxID=1736691 RepID=A0A1T4Z7W6_9ACTN|nr:DoxX family protein [Aeromicrobium choanae]SKB10064.1 DoxX-like family protein [Aeromicrobium choanae]